MIAARFRTLYCTASVAAAALPCYLISQHVATARTTLARTEIAIAATRREIRTLQTEIGARASMNQIERWNADIYLLIAPRQSQFVKSETQLAALDQSGWSAAGDLPEEISADRVVISRTTRTGGRSVGQVRGHGVVVKLQRQVGVGDVPHPKA